MYTIRAQLTPDANGNAGPWTTGKPEKLAERVGRAARVCPYRFFLGGGAHARQLEA